VLVAAALSRGPSYQWSTTALDSSVAARAFWAAQRLPNEMRLGDLAERRAGPIGPEVGILAGAAGGRYAAVRHPLNLGDTTNAVDEYPGYVWEANAASPLEL
jgi:hypothetical protein